MAVDPETLAMLSQLTGQGGGGMPQKNPLTQPLATLSGVYDPTEGRGWADDGDPGELRRMGENFSDNMRGFLSRLQSRAEGENGFDQVQLTEREQRLVEIEKSPEQLRTEAALWGSERVMANRRRLLGPMLDQAPPELTDLLGGGTNGPPT